MNDTSVLVSACRAICYEKHNTPYSCNLDKIFCADQIPFFEKLVEEKFPKGTIEVFGYRAEFVEQSVRGLLWSGREDTGVEFAQVVILGAGMDALSQHSDILDSIGSPVVPVFEVDRAPVQAFKREKIAAVNNINRYDDRHVRYVACDFDTQDVFQELEKAGFNARKNTIFVWVGVTYYLPEDKVIEMLAAIHRTMRGDFAIVLDYAVETGAPTTEAELELAKMGEPIKTKFKSLAPTLYKLGMRHLYEVSFQNYILGRGGVLYDGDARHLKFAVITSYDTALEVGI